MEELPREEISRLHKLLIEDDKYRNQQLFFHSYDIIVRNSASSLSIWPMPNADIRRILDGKINYNSGPILFDDNNEVQKGMLFEDQRAFISQHHPKKPMLCEARNYQTCFHGECPIFRERGTKAGGAYGICSEFKIAFQR